MPSQIVIVDCGTGNLNSVKRSLDRIIAGVIISSNAEDILRAEKIILPGIGHFGKAMSNLHQNGVIDALHQAVLVNGTPILGICLGMELMAKKSDEGKAEGLGWIDAEIIRFDVSDKNHYKIPHMGWNQISIKKDSLLMNSVPESSEFYFAHSYHLKINDPADLLNETRYETTFPSAIEKGNIFGVQYHPEKSHDAGARLLKNFIEM
ncbi:MAG: imidazole glycerol phosphate synthase subunit HisH [Saprospiraceae bacterium]|nr:imidazole glycerol phosphate synthase subunit HisH [Pyrinomonadaceae bacterium]